MTFNSTSRYLDDLLNNISCFEPMLSQIYLGQIYPARQQLNMLNNAILSYPEAPILTLDLSITNGIFSGFITCNKRDNFICEIVNSG